MASRREFLIEELVGQEMPLPERVLPGVILRHVYLDQGLIRPQEELKMILLLDALEHILKLPHILTTIKDKLKKNYKELSDSGYPPKPWQSFSDKVLGIYVANLTVDPERETVTARPLPLLNQNGKQIKSIFLHALAINRKTIR